jgi:hypothetical protein
MNDVTFFLTSCKRHDLLKICLESFEKHNTYPIQRGIIIEDSQEDISWCRDILKSIPNLELINTEGRRGQVQNIDRCYATIHTEYVFHCEDDFEFTRPGFVEASKVVLEQEPGCINVWLTPYEQAWENPQDTHRQLIGFDGVKIDHKQHKIGDVTYWNINSCVDPHGGEWGLGFTFQPSLHRMRDWKAVGGYQHLLSHYAPWANILDGGQTERNIARYYANEGYHTRMFAGPNDNEMGYCNGIGYKRHVPLPTQQEL